MSLLIQWLARICREHLLDEKWLIAPSLRVGHQWVDAVVRNGQPAVNVRISTIKGFALDLAASEMAAKGGGPDRGRRRGHSRRFDRKPPAARKIGVLVESPTKSWLVADNAVGDRNHPSRRHRDQDASARCV